MKATVNTLAISQKTLDSAGLSPCAMIAHPVREEGFYHGVVLQNGQPVGSFDLRVEANHHAHQADIDLLQFTPAADSCAPHEHTFAMKAGGHVMLFVSRAARGMSVRLETVSAKGKTKAVFDSQNLGQEDLFIAMLLRPGRWQIRHSGCKSTCRAQVAYCTPGKTPYQPGAPIQVAAAKGGFDAESVEVGPGQGIILRSEGEGAFRIDLEEPDDGPEGHGSTKGSFRRRSPPAR